jgi:hypothetical protein
MLSASSGYMDFLEFLELGMIGSGGDSTKASFSSWSTVDAHHDLGVVDYKALIGLSLLWVPHFHARRGASHKDLNLDTTSMNKAKCFLVR